MMTLYRPFVDHIRTAMVLSKNDRFHMKLRSAIIIHTILELKGWEEKTELSKINKNDPFVKYYYNNGKPYLDLLIDYHYTMYYYWLKACGTECEFIENVEDIYDKYRKKCSSKDPWRNGHCLMHKMYLLKWNYEWYKRHFRKHYSCTIKDYRLIKDNKPRKLLKSELIKEEVN